MPGQKQPYHQHQQDAYTRPRKQAGRPFMSRFTLRSSRHPTKAGAYLLLSSILATPINTLLPWSSVVGAGVVAAPCTNPAVAGEPQQFVVTPIAMLNMTSLFACEDGNFEVFWSGAVDVTGTIVIGNRTTVTLMGDRTPSSVAVDNTTNIGVDSTGSGNSSSSSENRVERMKSSRLSLPRGLSSEVVGAGPPVESALNDTISLSGPLFYVDGGSLIMSDLIVRDGYAVDANNPDNSNGAGIFSFGAVVNVTRCEFRNNFATVSGGGIYAEESTLVVVDSVFEGCQAGFQSVSGEEEAEGAGGAIWARKSYVLVDGCLFEGNYAGNKGGAIHHQDGNISVLGSVFYDNVAGSENEHDKEPKGQGGDLSFAECDRSVEGKAPCGVNDTVFVNGRTGAKGGSVSLSGSEDPSTVEFHRCSVENSSAGFDFKDDPQGEGGAFSVGEGVTLVLSDCLVEECSCGKKGGVLQLSSGEGWSEPGGTVIMRSSSFKWNTADRDSGGVANMAMYSTAVVEGDDNVFDGNECFGVGAVFSASVNTSITIEGGLFINNNVNQSGAVIWTNGRLEIVDGNFTKNESPKHGGVLLASEFSTINVAGGHFEGNKAQDGGVIMAVKGSIVYIEGGMFSGNDASSEGGAVSLSHGANIKITGGTFSNNMAEFGGFLHKEGAGETSCKGASIQHNRAADGGAMHVVDGATVDWACDIRSNTAITGGAIYSLNSDVILQGMVLDDNVVTDGSVVVGITSRLETYQVEFRESSRSGLSAHIVYEGSSYFAEETSFLGYEGEVVVSSEGELFLDNCDFSGSASSVLVYSEENSTAVIRNAILGDNNYLTLAAASSAAGKLPDANSFTNADHTCEDMLAGWGGTGTSTPDSDRPLCSEGSVCLDGDLGVYCECYYPQRTIHSSIQRCVGGNASTLALTLETEPAIEVFPQLIEGDIRLSYNASASESFALSSRSSSSDGSDNATGSGEGFLEVRNDDGGVVWTVQALQTASVGNWTIFPSSGLLLPGKGQTIRVVTLPSEGFDGTTVVRFQAIDGLLPFYMSSRSTTDEDMDGHVKSNSAPHHQGQDWNSSRMSTGKILSGGTHATVSFEVTFYHCEAGSLWGFTPANANSSGESGGSCGVCSENVDGEPEGVDCTHPGVTIRDLPIKEGYWRATLNEVFIRECFSKDACKGGTTVEDVDDYCREGYEGPQCAVCSSGYGKGAMNQCRVCSEGFKISMYFFVAISALGTVVVSALLAVYLIGGKNAIASTIVGTKETVRTLKRHRGRCRPPSCVGGIIDFGPLDVQSGSSNVCTNGSVDRAKGVGPDTTRNIDINEVSESSGHAGKQGIGIRINSSTRQTKNGKSIIDRMRGSLLFNDDTRLSKTPPGGACVQPCSSSPVVNQHRGPAIANDTGASVLFSSTSVRASSEVCLRRASSAGPSPVPMRDVVVGGRDTSSATTKIGGTLAALPLSKVKIVIVVWQISSAFADVTGARFPPIYEKFVSVIALFSLDLGWIFSMACLATGITFYHRLLIVTIGPVVLLGLLGITFGFGSRPSKPRVAQEHIIETRTWTCRAWQGITADFPSRGSSRDSVSGGVSVQHDRSSVAAETLPAQGLKQNVMTATDTGDPGTPMGGVTQCRQSSWIIDVGDEGVAGAGGNSSTAMGLKSRSILDSEHPLRKMWRVGSESDPQQNQLWDLFSRHASMALIILYLVYSMVSTVVFQTFACEDYPELSKRYLKADSRIECDTITHSGYEMYAAIMICLYPLGIPAIFAFLLVRRSSAINPATDKRLDEPNGTQEVVRDKIERRRMDKTIAPTSFLWGAYYPNRYYFEVFECLRRLLLTSVLVFVPDKSGQAAAYGCIFAFLSLFAFELQRPHIDNLETQLYRTGCLVIFFTNFLALVIQVELAQADSSSSAVYSVMLITVHVLIVVSICWNSWATMKATFSRRHVQGMVLGLDIVSEESADKILGPETSKRETTYSSTNADLKTEDEGIVQSSQT